MWGEDKKVPESRKRGDKAPHFTTIRHKLENMERSEWKEWYVQCLEELQRDEAVWNWISREKGWKPMPQILKGKWGRPPRDLRKNLPDTRNLNWDEI